MQPGRRHRWLRTVTSWALVFELGGLGAYFVWTLQRAHRLYGFLKDEGRGWTHRVYRPDGELGFAPVPGAAGGDMLPGGPPIPTRFDEDGFRVPISDGGARQRPLILALGDSFTYGAGCLAEEAYAHRIARALGGTALNAGSPSYGLPQVLILARRLIPRFAPDIVLVQYSGLLVARAQARYAQSFFGVMPTPYFAAGATGPRLQPPPFGNRVLDLPLTEFRSTPRSASDYASFLGRAALPLFLHDDVAVARVEAGQRLRLLPALAADPEAIVRDVYSEIEALCREHAARMLIVLLGRPPSAERRRELERHAPAVDAELALCRGVDAGCEVPVLSEAYLEAYGHLRGSPPRLVDSHPNPRAHAVIAEEVMRTIRSAPMP
jgi:hypothetical protein